MIISICIYKYIIDTSADDIFHLQLQIACWKTPQAPLSYSRMCGLVSWWLPSLWGSPATTHVLPLWHAHKAQWWGQHHRQPCQEYAGLCQVLFQDMVPRDSEDFLEIPFAPPHHLPKQPPNKTQLQETCQVCCYGLYRITNNFCRSYPSAYMNSSTNRQVPPSAHIKQKVGQMIIPISIDN